jgi:hypothetical protein
MHPFSRLNRSSNSARLEATESMKLLNSIDIDTPWGIRSFELRQGDVTELGFAVNLLMLSAVESDFYPLTGTVINALKSKLGISIERLSEKPEFACTEPSGRIWVSDVIDPSRIGRIMCLEVQYGGANATKIVRQAFRSLPMLEARGFVLETICLPVLGSGAHGLPTEELLPAILDGAQWALRVLRSADRICFAEINPERASMMSDAMDDVLGRIKVVAARGTVVEAVRTEISSQLETLIETDYDAIRVAERLRRAISEGSRSADIGMAGRWLREFVVAKVLFPDDIKKMTPFEIMQGLRKRLVAEWVICYLNLLHAFGNESAHHKTQITQPSEIEDRDLAVCLFAIQRVLDFWFEWQPSK